MKSVSSSKIAMSMLQPDSISSTSANPAARPSVLVGAWPRRVVLLTPLFVFVGIAIFRAIGLTLDPRIVPSVLIGKPVPAFSLPPVRGLSLGLASTDLVGEVSLVNVFASWCVACRDEHPVFMQFRKVAIVPIHGLNYVSYRQGRIAHKHIGAITSDVGKQTLLPLIRKLQEASP